MVLALLIGIPLAALVAAVPVAWGWGLSWADAGIAVVMYLISGHGITIGYHRLFTHRSFRASAPAARVCVDAGVIGKPMSDRRVSIGTVPDVTSEFSGSAR